MKQLKEDVYQACLAIIKQRIDQAKELILVAQRGANEETRSSMGDKYETARSMAHLEIEKINLQLSQILKQRQLLSLISADKISTTINLGSVIKTSRGNYFLAVGIGSFSVGDEEFIGISVASPLGKAFLNKRTGDVVALNQCSYMINDVI